MQILELLCVEVYSVQVGPYSMTSMGITTTGVLILKLKSNAQGLTYISDKGVGEALSDTLGKLTSAHLARGPTPHEGWALEDGGQRPISLEYQIKPPPLKNLIL